MTERAGTHFVEGNRAALLHDGAQCLPAMLEAIRAAEREILLEMYWFGSDATGLRFAKALSEKARQGVRVLITYDALGSLESERDMFDAMRGAGCGVYEFNPIRLSHPRFRFAALKRRNHRKMLIADGSTAITGGINLADPWAPAEEGGQAFRDDVIRIDGPAVAAMRAIFLETYRGPELTAARAQTLPPAAPCGDCRVRVLHNRGRRRRRSIEHAYLARIGAARERVLVTNSYFIPRRRVRAALADAVRRGVEVRILLPVESDVPAVNYATHYLFQWMLDHGIELYEWGQSILHSKTAVIDAAWCTVGTYNLDYRSWAYNLEINVAVENAAVARQLERRVLADIAASHQVSSHDWRFRPLSQRLLEPLFYRLRRLL